MRMRPFILLIIAAAVSLTSGCRFAQRQQVELLERQNRMLKDEVYRLRWLIQDYENELATARGEVIDDDESPVPRLFGPTRSADAAPEFGAGSEESSSGAPSVELPTVDATPGEEISPDEFLRGRLDEAPQSESQPPVPMPVPDEPEPLERPEDVPDESTEPGDAPLFESDPAGPTPQPRPLDDSRDVRELRLDPAASGDGKPGDDGLLVVLVPLGEDGQPLAAPAEVSLALLDPALEDSDARLARWDFSADEVDQLMRRETAPGIPLRVRWGEASPEHEALHLFARYTTADGRRIEADVPITIALTDTSDRSANAAPPTGWKAAAHPISPPTDTARDAEPGVTTGAARAKPDAVIASRTQSDDTHVESSEPSVAEPAAPPAATSADDQSLPRLEAPVWSPERP